MLCSWRPSIGIPCLLNKVRAAPCIYAAWQTSSCPGFAAVSLAFSPRGYLIPPQAHKANSLWSLSILSRVGIICQCLGHSRLQIFTNLWTMLELKTYHHCSTRRTRHTLGGWPNWHSLPVECTRPSSIVCLTCHSLLARCLPYPLQIWSCVQVGNRLHTTARQGTSAYRFLPDSQCL